MGSVHRAARAPGPRRVRRVLVVTNDFPPRPGGIQAYLHALLSRQPVGSVAVYASRFRGWEKFDAQQSFPVVRHPGGLLLPAPSALRRTREVARAEGCTTVLYGALAPLGLLTRGLRASGVDRFVGMTHGHEAGWASLPGTRHVLRRIGDEMDAITYVGEYTRSRIASGLSPTVAARMTWLPPGVDDQTFVPGAGGGGGGSPRLREPADRRLRVPAGASQGAGHVDPGLAGDLACGARRRPAARRWRSLPRQAGATGRRGGPARVGGTDRIGSLVGTPGLLRRRECVRHALPHPRRRSRRRGPRHRLPRGVSHRAARHRGELRGAPDAVLDGQTGYVVDGRSVDQLVQRITSCYSTRTWRGPWEGGDGSG